MKFITTAPDRRTLVKAIAAHTGMEPSCIGPPTFNYTVGTITIDREGYVDVPDEQAAPALPPRATTAKRRPRCSRRGTPPPVRCRPLDSGTAAAPCPPRSGVAPRGDRILGLYRQETAAPSRANFRKIPGWGYRPKNQNQPPFFRTTVCIENGEG